ncbi:Hpt domain-containing protein [Psychrobacter jeotgali]|uniref:Hpt domain-containing protein n=1 Tax=Psychrobacter jeotgali TaxID=179010 RepID=UPI00191A2A9C|nr:Hpt domain-containing protein [Psychrobacter jeotgali]
MTEAYANQTITDDSEIIDDEQFEDMRQLLEDDFVELIQAYITDSEQRISALRLAQAANDNAAGFEVAHTLKGASANLGATQLVVLSDHLQEACRARKIDQQSTLMDQLSTALQRVKNEINHRLSP